jgi:protein involved in polysaccharide export with SLBB domain
VWPRWILRTPGAVILGAGLLVGCSTLPESCSPAGADVADVAGYRLGPDDQLQITVYRQPDLSGRFRLDGEGYLALPLAGEIPAARLTTRELEQAIAARLRDGNYLVTPQVSIQVLAYRPFYILGEINNPGRYEYRDGMTVTNAVALAGGYTYRARASKITVKRAGCTVVAHSDTLVLPDEVITVPERFI